jgi:serine/threonine protein kinase
MSRLYNSDSESWQHQNTQEEKTNSYKNIKSPLVRMQSLVGTPVYMAPEVYSRNYDYRCDYWSIGVIMFSMLSARFPF